MLYASVISASDLRERDDRAITILAISNLCSAFYCSSYSDNSLLHYLQKRAFWLKCSPNYLKIVAKEREDEELYSKMELHCSLNDCAHLINTRIVSLSLTKAITRNPHPKTQHNRNVLLNSQSQAVIMRKVKLKCCICTIPYRSSTSRNLLRLLKSSPNLLQMLSEASQTRGGEKHYSKMDSVDADARSKEESRRNTEDRR